MCYDICQVYAVLSSCYYLVETVFLCGLALCMCCFSLFHHVVTDAASTTKYPSVNSIKGYVDQFTLTSTATINLTVANTVLSHSFTGVASVTSPGSRLVLQGFHPALCPAHSAPV